MINRVVGALAAPLAKLGAAALNKATDEGIKYIQNLDKAEAMKRAAQVAIAIAKPEEGSRILGDNKIGVNKIGLLTRLRNVPLNWFMRR